MLMQSVVLPNMLATIKALFSWVSISVSTMPQMAPAARLKMTLEIELSPATSTMEGIMVMSLVPK